jgi:hypothetical protein
VTTRSRAGIAEHKQLSSVVCKDRHAWPGVAFRDDTAVPTSGSHRSARTWRTMSNKAVPAHSGQAPAVRCRPMPPVSVQYATTPRPRRSPNSASYMSRPTGSDKAGRQGQEHLRAVDLSSGNVVVGRVTVGVLEVDEVSVDQATVGHGLALTPRDAGPGSRALPFERSTRTAEKPCSRTQASRLAGRPGGRSSGTHYCAARRRGKTEVHVGADPIR